MTPREAWRKSLGDLASTRIQATYLFLGIAAAITIKGLLLARTVTDIATLLTASWPLMLLILGNYFGDKVLTYLKERGH